MGYYFDKLDLKELTGKAKAILKELPATQKAIAARPRLKTNASEEEIEKAQRDTVWEQREAKQAALDKLTALQSQRQELTNRIKAELNNSIRPPARDTNEALLHQMQQDAAWRRLHPLLETAATPATAGSQLATATARIDALREFRAQIQQSLAEALSSGDEATVQALRENVPLLAQAKFGPDSRRAVNEEIISGIASARPEVGKTLAQLLEVEQGAASVELALTTALRTIEEERPFCTLAAWPGEGQPEEVYMVENGASVSFSAWGGSRVLQVPQEG